MSFGLIGTFLWIAENTATFWPPPSATGPGARRAAPGPARVRSGHALMVRMASVLSGSSNRNPTPHTVDGLAAVASES